MATIPHVSRQFGIASHDDWWVSLKHGELLIAPAKLEEFFVAGDLPPLSRYLEKKLRRDVTRLQDGDTSQLGTVLEEVLALPKAFWQKFTFLKPNLPGRCFAPNRF